MNDAGSLALNENRAASPFGNSFDRLVCGGVTSFAVTLGRDRFVEGDAIPVPGKPVTEPGRDPGADVTSLVGEGASDCSAEGATGSGLLLFGVRPSDVGDPGVRVGRSPSSDGVGPRLWTWLADSPSRVGTPPITDATAT